MIKAYFFDFGGTLAEVKEPISVSGTFGQEIKNALFTRPFHNVEFNDGDRKRAYKALSETKIDFYQDSKEVLSNLRKEGYKLALVSNMYEITAKLIRKSFPEFINMFDFLAISSEIGVMKPDLKIFDYTLNNINNNLENKISPDQCVMIGDSLDYDYYPAIKFGMQVKFIDRKKQNLSDILNKI